MPRKTDGAEIEYTVRCDCGFEARGTESILVPIVQRHGREAHRMEVTRREALAMMKPV
jgi:predicted small metal-binding protein